MKGSSVGLAAHLAGRTTTLATCWRVERMDGQVFGFTDHDRDLVFEGLTYAAATGYQRAAIGSRADLSVDETELTGLLDSDLITAEELRAGLWDGAEVRIFLVNHANLSHGALKLRRGRLGEVVLQDDGSFKAELRGLTQMLQQTVGELYGPECRADLGDARCKLAITSSEWTRQMTVESVPDRETLIAADLDGISAFADGWFAGGVLTVESGANAGVSRDVVDWVQATRTLSLFLPLPYPLEAGDTVLVQPGCDKRRETCKTKFSNLLNFRGEPDIPGMQALLGAMIG